jgi:hypothetical protein
MKTKRYGCLLVILSTGVILGWLAFGTQVEAEQPSRPNLPAKVTLPPTNLVVRQAVGQDMLALAELVDKRFQQVTLIDSKRQVICVYHIELATGKIALRSVRKIEWDLKMTDFNGSRPLPQEIQALSEQR